MSSPILALLAVVSASGSVPEVRGEITCPSPQEVSARLEPMLSSDATFPSGDFIELADVAARAAGFIDVEIRLRRSGTDAPVAVRRVARAGGCSDTTDALAVIAASWAGRFTTPGPSVEPVPVASDAATPVSALAIPLVLARVPPRFSLGVDFAAVTASAGGAAPVIGAELETRRGRWDVRLAVVGVAERALTFSPGEAIWRRLIVHPSAGFRWGSHFAFVQVDAGPLFAVTETKGRGFATNGSEVAVEWGLAPGIRVGASLATLPAQLWLGATAMVWLRPHTVTLKGVEATRAVPSLDICLGGGASFLFGADS